jgi:signal transduction histidine kinase
VNDLPLQLVALGFQALCTLALAGVHFGLWRAQARPFHLSWSLAWTMYALRLGAISMYLVTRHEVWLFAHQTVTGWAALLLLFAAVQFNRGWPWRPVYALAGLASPAWAAFALWGIRNYAIAGASSTLLLFTVTLWTAAVFWHRDRHQPSTGSRILAWAFTLWSLHHLDYPLLRSQGAGLLYGVFADVGLIVLVALGTLVLVLGEGRRVLALRTAELEQLTRLLLHAQEEERRRIARELHDEAGQALTALKIELDLEGRTAASALAARALSQVRDLSNLLRPQAIDDLGLVPALRTMAEDFAARTHLEVEIATPEAASCPGEIAMTLYRVGQEALTNVARHAEAKRAWLTLEFDEREARLVVEDDGRGPDATMKPHLGLLGMHERVIGVGGRLWLGRGASGGMRVEATLPMGDAP